MIRSAHYTSPYKLPVLKLELENATVTDEDIFAEAREFFQLNHKEKEVHIDCPSRGISMLIDREHPEIDSGTNIK